MTFEEWKRLAEQGDAEAQFGLGVMFIEGQGVAQDDAEAAKWFRNAAEQGRAVAQFNLGVMYATSQGVPQDHVQALMWFNLAAAHGEPHARKVLEFLAKMTPAHMAEGQRLAWEWKPKALPSGGHPVTGMIRHDN